VPLPEVLRAYRLGFAYFWDRLLVEADRDGAAAQAALLRAAARVWGMADAYATALTTAYRDAVAEQLVEADRRRSALVAALVDGPAPGSDTVWEIAQMLDFPFDGTFVFVSAEAVRGTQSPLPGLDAELRALCAASAWRAQPGCEVGVLSLPRPAAVEQVLAAIKAAATGRVGVSPAYERLDQTPRALRFAQVALESLPAAGALFCHQNTVRYRMHRLEEYLRGSLDDPKIVAELAMALDAVGTFPMLLDQRRSAASAS
jgi:hypothetical protein